ncbi:MAG: hypothetical protein R2912_06100 [Eubacteriales bacterium]
MFGKHLERMTQGELIMFRQRHIGFIFQSFNLMPYYTALENVALPLSFRGMPRGAAQANKEMLDAVSLATHMRHKPSEALRRTAAARRHRARARDQP